MTVNELIEKLLKAQELGFGEVVPEFEASLGMFGTVSYKMRGLFLCEDGDLSDEYTPEKHVTLLTTP